MNASRAEFAAAGHHGHQTPIFLTRLRKERSSQRTGGRLALVQGAGHYPQTEMPEVTASLVLDFLKQSAS
jgi:hypothetical protein